MSRILTKSPAKSIPKTRAKTTRPELKRTKKARTKSKRALKVSKLKRASRKAASTPLGSSAFRSLRSAWYAKLKKKGFRDLEYTPQGADDSTEYIQTGSLAVIARQYKPETLHYYRRWSCYLSYCKHNIKSKKEQAILQLYSDGISYRGITKQLKPIYKVGVSITAIHAIIKYWEPIVERWNTVSQYGLDFEPDVGLII